MRNITLLLVFTLSSISLLAQGNWIQLPNAPSGEGRFDDIFFLPNTSNPGFETGWAANGPSGNVYKTTDGGLSWQYQFGHNGYNRNIEFIDENIGFLGTLDGVFYKTTNGGASWSPISMSPNPPAICGLDAVGANTVYGCGAWFEPAYIIKSVDAGDTWEFIDMSNYADALVEILFIDENHGFASGKGGTGGVILETFDGGTTWNIIHNTQDVGDYVWKLQLMDANQTIFGSVQSGSQGKLIKSFDGGSTWDTKNVPDDFVQAVGFINQEVGWIGGHNSGFFETTDGGTTWTDLNLGFSLNRFFIFNENLAYCSGDGIYKFEDVLSNPDFEVQREADLAVRIAPLPIKDKLQIAIDFTHKDNLLMELYDTSGRRLAKLHRDQIAQPETKTYTFNFEYPTGTYILDIQSNNGRRTYTIVKE